MERDRRRITHLSLFSGIGGLDLAAEWAGIETIGQCEWADYPTKVLEKHWPDIPRWKDIRTLTGEIFMSGQDYEQLTLFQEGFLANPFPLPGSSGAKRMTAISGRKWSELSKNSGRFGLLEKMLLESYEWHSPIYYLNWKPWVSDKGISCTSLRCRSQTPAVQGCNCGLRRTRWTIFRKIAGSLGEAGTGEQKREKTSGEFEGAGELGNSQKMGKAGLGGQIKLWPTPTRNGNYNRPGASKTSGLGLALAVKMYHTPTAQDGKNCTLPKSQINRASLIGDVTREQFLQQASGARLPDRAKGKVEKPEKEQELERPDSNVPNADNGSRDVRGNREFPGSCKRLEEQGVISENEREEYEPGGWRGSLNPYWVEWLMGFPPGWTETS